MGTGLSLRYDKVGDILYIDAVAPYAEQESDRLGDDIVGRMNPETGAVENLEVLFFSHRLDRGDVIDLPVRALLEPAD